MTTTDTAIQALPAQEEWNEVRSEAFRLKNGDVASIGPLLMAVDRFGDKCSQAVAADQALRALPAVCRVCFETEPHTGSCGSADATALCNLAASPPAPLSVDLFDVAVECCVTGQLRPGEGIEDGAERIAAVLRDNFPASPVVGDARWLRIDEQPPPHDVAVFLYSANREVEARPYSSGPAGARVFHGWATHWKHIDFPSADTAMTATKEQT